MIKAVKGRKRALKKMTELLSRKPSHSFFVVKGSLAASSMKSDEDKENLFSRLFRGKQKMLRKG